ncbi:MAG TPA: glycosyltransferase [Clostridia bacterium]|nr:glycosyltransferase [Clostridia bacterium]
MSWFHPVAGWVLALVWAGHLVDAALGMRRIVDISTPEWDIPEAKLVGLTGKPALPHVTIVVPARNEELNIEEALHSLIALDYDNYRIIAVDDRSTDRTGEIMDGIVSQSNGLLRVLHVRELPKGWLGKTHAMWLAAGESVEEDQQNRGDDWILFTDADVVFRSDALRRAIACAEHERAGHLVLFPTLITRCWDERMMIGFFHAMFALSQRPWKVSDPDSADYAGIGAFNLVRRSAYEEIGTYKRLRLAVIDDMMLGYVLKKNGFEQRNVLGRDLIRLHWAAGALGIVNNLTKNFFAFMRFNWILAVFACLAVLSINLGPFIGVLSADGWSRWAYVVALVCLALMYVEMNKRTGISFWYFFLHPVSTMLFSYSILRSTVVTLAQGGIRWRGTMYSLDELRKGLETEPSVTRQRN